MPFLDFIKYMNAMSLFSSQRSVTVAVTFCALFYMVTVSEGIARQYGQSRNDIYSRPQVGYNQGVSGNKKLLTADETNADVLKELGVDLSHEGIANFMISYFMHCVAVVLKKYGCKDF